MPTSNRELYRDSILRHLAVLPQVEHDDLVKALQDNLDLGPHDWRCACADCELFGLQEYNNRHSFPDDYLLYESKFSPDAHTRAEAAGLLQCRRTGENYIWQERPSQHGPGQSMTAGTPNKQ
jgi:hypothetical protein